MKVMLLHNHYQQRGGEDYSTAQEIDLLRSHGHEVLLLTRHNDEINEYNIGKKAALFFTPTWSSHSRRIVANEIRAFRPDIVHIQNFFPLFSPAVHVTCSKASIPVIQSLRNYRLLAPCALLIRNDAVCEKCIKGTLWNGIALRCYRNSAIQTASVALMIKTHRVLRTWDKHVDAFVALTDFARDMFVEAGFDASKIVVRPNFLSPDPGTGTNARDGAVFIGRLSEEKGIRTLLAAWCTLTEAPMLTLVGDGPLAEWVRTYVKENSLSNVSLLGWIGPSEVINIVKKTCFFILPSVCYEGFPRTLVEAFATGTPALVSGHGSVGSIVTPGKTGLHFKPGDANDLAEKAQYMFDHPEETAEWGRNARAEYLEKYTAESAYQSLMEIYEAVIERRRYSK